MQSIKSYTDLEQSKKLAEILPLESADMCYEYIGKLNGKYRGTPINTPVLDDDLPCWSLASLLFVLDFPSLTQNKEDEWEVCVFDHDNDGYIEKTASNPIDACYEMILKLHELEIL